MADTKYQYDVTVEGSELKWEHAGPLFDRYTLTLTGRLDRRWADCYQRIGADSTSFSRFRLEPGAGSITFTCRSSDGPAVVMKTLKQLAELLVQVNLAAEAAARPPAPPAQVATPPRPPAAAPQPAKPGPASIASGLLSRFTHR
jgi:hypothetical protein